MTERRTQRALPLFLLLLCIQAFAGCGPAEQGEAGDVPVLMRVRQPLGIGSVGISRITLLISTSIADPVTLLPTPGSTVFARDLIPNGSAWTSRFGLAEGDYFVRAEAFDGAVSVGATAALPVTITAGTVPVIDLLLSVSHPDGAILNHAPTFDLVHVSTAWAAPGEEVEITIHASDADGDTLTLLPTDLGCTLGGIALVDESEQSLAAGSAHILRWTAPGGPADCNLQLELRDARGAASLAFVPLAVGSKQQALTAGFTILAAPILSSLTLQPAAPDPVTGDFPVALAATGVAADGSQIAAWSWSFDASACMGTFTPVDGAQTVFHLESFAGAATECALVVRAAGSDGASAEGAVYLQQPPTVRYRPALWLEFLNNSSPGPNGDVVIRVRSVVKNANPVFSWTPIANSTVQNGPLESTFTWRVPMHSIDCASLGNPVRIQVSVTDPVWNETSAPVVVPITVHKNACIK